MHPTADTRALDSGILQFASPDVVSRARQYWFTVRWYRTIASTRSQKSRKAKKAEKIPSHSNE
jgi:hypothetical protein